MLQVINRYYRSFLGTFFIIIIGLSMLLFGVDFGSRPTQTYAIKVNEREVSFSEFYERKSQVQAQLARNLGANYAQFASQILKGLNQRLADELIEETLLKDIALQLGFSPGKRYVQGMIRQLFPNGFTQESYRSLLQQIGTSAAQFENQLASESLIRQIKSLLEQAAAEPPQAFVKSNFLREERSYTVEVAEFDAKNLTDSVEAPSDETLQAFFEERMIDYENAPAVKLSYLPFPPDKFKKEVEVFEEDVELFYTDNQRRFTTPERIKIQEIVLKLPANDAANALGVQSLANELLEKLENGEDLEKLAKEYSDDKKKGAISDWIIRGSQSGKFDELLYGDENDNSDVKLIEEPNQLRLVRQVARETSALRPLEEVKEEIKNELMGREAPIYAAEIARAKYDEWLAGDKSLDDFAEEFSVKVQKIEKFTSVDETTQVNRDMVRTALEEIGAEKLIVDTGRALALVRVDEYREAEIPAFEEIKEEVKKDFIAIEAKTVAANKATEFAASLADAEKFQADAAKKLKATVTTLKDQKFGGFTSPLSNPTVRDKIIGTTSPGLVSTTPFSVNDKHYVLWATDIKDPTPEAFKEKKEELEQKASTRLASIIEESLLNRLRAKADIDVHPTVYDE